MKLTAATLISLLLTTAAHAQTEVDGRTAYYDASTDSYLVSVPEGYEPADVPDTVSVEFTHLPVIRLSGDFGYDYTFGEMSLSAPDSPTVTYSIKAKWRGGMTNGSGRNKRNFHIKLIDSDGEKRDDALLGMRNDNSWLLDAAQIDLSRMRNHIAHEIWRDMENHPYYYDKEPKARSYVDAEMAEVFINDRYYGVYSLTEAIDRKQMRLKKYDEESLAIHGMLWKATGYTNATMWGPFTDTDDSSDSWGGFELKYPDTEETGTTDWSVLHDAIMFVADSSDEDFASEVDRYFDMPVIVDFFVFNVVTGAIDHYGKNTYWACYDIQSDCPLTPGIWDYDTTIGQYISNTTVHPEDYWPEEPGGFLESGGPKLTYRLWFGDADGFTEKVKERYWQMRGTVFDADSLTARYRDHFDLLEASGAVEREEERWSGDTDIACQTLDLASEQEYISWWIEKRITYLDGIFGTENGIHEITAGNAGTSEKTYNLSGQAVDAGYKGIVITGGRKHIRIQ